MSSSTALPDRHADEIWNPWAALVLSLVFTPAFGTMLHETDLRHIGDDNAAASAYYWSRGSMILLAVAAVLQPIAAQRSGWEFLLFTVDAALFFAWAAACGVRHAIEISAFARESKKFRKVPMSKAITLGLLGLLAWAVLFHIAKTVWELAGVIPAA